MTLEAKLDAIGNDIREIKGEMMEMRKIRESLDKLNQLPKRLETLEEDVLGMADDVDDCKKENQRLKERLVSLEQYSRKNNLLISGIRVSEDENVREIVKKMAASMGIVVNESDMDIVHRMPERNGESTIIAKLNNRELKVSIIRSSKKLKLNSSFLNTQETVPVYCEDHLVPEYRKALMAAKRLKKEGRIKDVWVRDCTVKIRVNDESGAVIITNEEQLAKFTHPTETTNVPSGSTQVESMIYETSENELRKKRTVEERSPGASQSGGGVTENERKMLKVGSGYIQPNVMANLQKQKSQVQSPRASK